MTAIKMWIFIFFVFTGEAVVAEKEIFAPAVTFARLGLGFDVSSGQIGAMLLKPGTKLEQKRVDFLSTDFHLVSTSQDVKRVLNIGGSLSLDLTYGKAAGFSLSAAGSYLNDEGDRRDYAELLFSSQIRNVENFITATDENIIDDCLRIPKNHRGSHVITGITTGGHCIVSVKFWVSSSKHKELVQAEAKAGLNATVASAGIKGKLRRLESMFSKKANITVSTYCSAVMAQLPTNPEEAIDVTRKFLHEHYLQNPGGVPLQMRLTPLSTISKCSSRSKDEPKESLWQKRFKMAIVNKLTDVRFAYEELVRCTSKFPLREKGHEDYLTNLYKTKKVLRQLMIKLNAKEKSLEKLKEDEFDFIQLRNLYYQSIDTNKFDFDNTLWRQHVSSLCADLAVTWAKDQPSNATEAEVSPFADSRGGSGKNNCRQRNLLSDAEIYVYETKLAHRFRRLHGSEGQNVLNDIKTNQGVAKFAMINPYLFLIRLKRPASSISYINVEGMFYHKNAWDHSDTDMFGFQVFIGHWISSSSKVTTYKPNFDNFAKILEHPGPEIEKMFPDIYNHYKTKRNIKGHPYQPFFQGEAIRKQLDVKEPFGILILRSESPVIKFISGLQLYGTECVWQNERFE